MNILLLIRKNIEKYVEVLNSDSKESIHLIGHALDVLDKLDEKGYR